MALVQLTKEPGGWMAVAKTNTETVTQQEETMQKSLHLLLPPLLLLLLLLTSSDNAGNLLVRPLD